MQTIIFYSLLGLKNVTRQRTGKSVRLLFTKMMHACTRCVLFGRRNWLQIRRGKSKEGVPLYIILFSNQSMIHFIIISVQWKPTSFNKRRNKNSFLKKKKGGGGLKKNLSEFQILYRIKVHHLPLRPKKSGESKQQLIGI